LLPSAHDLIPLELAAAYIFRRTYEERVQISIPGRPAAHLDGLAYLLSTMVTLYSYPANGQGIRELGKEDLAGGLFRDGAKCLYFLDGRKEITPLAMRADAIGPIIAAMIDASSYTIGI
jgi:hypothetical protein